MTEENEIIELKYVSAKTKLVLFLNRYSLFFLETTCSYWVFWVIEETNVIIYYFWSRKL